MLYYGETFCSFKLARLSKARCFLERSVQHYILQLNPMSRTIRCKTKPSIPSGARGFFVRGPRIYAMAVALCGRVHAEERRPWKPDIARASIICLVL